MAQKKLLFTMILHWFKWPARQQTKRIRVNNMMANLTMMNLIMILIFVANSNQAFGCSNAGHFDADIPNIAISNEDKNKDGEIDKGWILNLVRETRQTAMTAIWNKYIELQRMLGFKQETGNSFSKTNEEIVQELLTTSATLRVFVSTSMTTPLLKTYITEAKRYGAILVFNGVPNGSFREFSEFIFKLVDDESDSATIQIDDEAFKRFNIHSVPSFVLSNDDRDSWQDLMLGEDSEPEIQSNIYDKVVGNIGIRGALRLMMNQGDMADDASDLLDLSGGAK